jgi:hypothetical protein
MAELLGSPDLVTRLAQAADVAVVVGATEPQRDDVVWHGRRREYALRLTVSAERLGRKAT